MSDLEVLFWFSLLIGAGSMLGIALVLAQLVVALLIGAYEDWQAWRRRRWARLYRPKYWPDGWLV